jgi:hypothetical protein
VKSFDLKAVELVYKNGLPDKNKLKKVKGLSTGLLSLPPFPLQYQISRHASYLDMNLVHNVRADYIPNLLRFPHCNLEPRQHTVFWESEGHLIFFIAKGGSKNIDNPPVLKVCNLCSQKGEGAVHLIFASAMKEGLT